MRPFCALCTDYIVGTVHRQPLGKNDAMVDVCGVCAQAKPREKYGPERAYEGGGPSLSVIDARRGAIAAVGQAEYDRKTRHIQHERQSIHATPPDLKAIRDVLAEGERRRRTGASKIHSRRSSREKWSLK